MRPALLREESRIIAQDQEDTMQNSAGFIALRLLDADVQRAEHELAFRRAAAERSTSEQGRLAALAWSVGRVARHRRGLRHAPQFAQ
jgi:hypothetical protein